MIRVYMLTYLVFSSFFIRAQDIVEFNVVYNFLMIEDLNDKENPCKSEMILLLGKSSSSYSTLEMHKTHKQFMARTNQPAVMKSSGTTRTVVGKPMISVSKASSTQKREQIIKDIKKNQYDKIGLIGLKEFHVNDKIPVIEWQIKPAQKVILNYNCQYAEGVLAGRTYHVWFTTDLPFSDGPWLLNGLPGLILEAEDSKKEVAFSVKWVTKNINPAETVRPFSNYDNCIKIKESDYRKAMAMFVKNPQEYAQAQVSGEKLIINKEGDAKLTAEKKYNSIELD